MDKVVLTGIISYLIIAVSQGIINYYSRRNVMERLLADTEFTGGLVKEEISHSGGEFHRSWFRRIKLRRINGIFSEIAFSRAKAGFIAQRSKRLSKRFELFNGTVPPNWRRKIRSKVLNKRKNFFIRLPKTAKPAQ